MMHCRGWRPPQRASASKPHSWAVKADNQKFRLDVPDHQMQRLNVAEKSLPLQMTLNCYLTFQPQERQTNVFFLVG